MNLVTFEHLGGPFESLHHEFADESRLAIFTHAFDALTARQRERTARTERVHKRQHHETIFQGLAVGVLCEGAGNFWESDSIGNP
jgi:hypothetical protein